MNVPMLMELSSAPPNMESRDFTFEGGAAGAFDGEADLSKSGRVRYEPYRSGSHYNMVQAIKRDGFAIVEVNDHGVRRALKVSLQENGVLEILATDKYSRMITVEQAKHVALEWLVEAEREMNAFGSALPGYAERPKDHLMILESATEEHDFGWVFYWNTREYLETGDIRHALGGNAPLIVDRDDGSLHLTGTAMRTAVYIDEYRKKRKTRRQN